MAEVHVFGRVTNDLQLKMSHRQVPYVSFGLVEWIGRRDTGHRQYFEVWAWGTDALSLADAEIRKDSRIWVQGFLELVDCTRNGGSERDADIVYPKSWAPFAAMEKRTNLYAEGDADGIKALEKELLAQNADHKDWCCTEELMKTTKDGKALYLHCLPADINDVSCKDGEVEASVFDRYRTPLYKEASYKPYIIAAMIFLAKVKNPQATLKALEERGIARWFQK